MTCSICLAPDHESPQTLHVDGRPVDQSTGRFLDERAPAYVSDSAQRFVDRFAQLPRIIEDEKRRKAEAASRHAIPKPPISDETYRQFGVVPPHLRRR